MDQAMTGPYTGHDLQYTALVTVDSTSLLITDSQFEGVYAVQDTLLCLHNSSLRMQNTSFIGNQAARHPAFVAQYAEEVSIFNSTFQSNIGVLLLTALQSVQHMHVPSAAACCAHVSTCATDTTSGIIAINTTMHMADSAAP